MLTCAVKKRTAGAEHYYFCLGHSDLVVVGILIHFVAMKVLSLASLALLVTGCVAGKAKAR